MELQITKLFNGICPSDYSASVAEIGRDAGADTWRAACEDSEDYSDLLEPEGAREALIEHLCNIGLTDADTLKPDDTEQLTALLIQLVAGVMRDFIPTFGSTAVEWDWDEYQNQCDEGTCSGCLYQGDDNEVYYYLGS